MTQRDFYTAVINNTINNEVIDFAKAEIVKLDARNEKRKNTPTKEQLANEEIKKAMLELIQKAPMLASELGTMLNITTQKASALALQLVNAGDIVAVDYKIKGKGTVKQYKIVVKEG